MSEALSVAIKKRLGSFDLDVAFEGAAGITVLFGPSGAGEKLNAGRHCGEVRPDNGHIAVDEAVLFDKAARIDLKPEARRIGWVFQDARLFPHLSVEGNLRFGLKRATVASPRIAFDEVAAVLGLGASSPAPRDLSGGEAQRVSFGRALLSQPRLLLMDEPLSALDDFRKEEILAFIGRVRSAFASPILYVTHSRAEALRLADRIVVLDNGRVIGAGPPEETMAAAIARFSRASDPSPISR